MGIEDHILKAKGLLAEIGIDYTPVHGKKDVYFIQEVHKKASCTPSERVKIGISDHILKRRETLEQQSLYPLRLVAIIVKGGREIEKKLHNYFSDYHHSKEWFNPSSELLNLIENLGYPRGQYLWI